MTQSTASVPTLRARAHAVRSDGRRIINVMTKRSRRRSPSRPQQSSPRTPGRGQTATPDPDRLLLDAIADGELDHSLNALADAIGARLLLLNTVQAAKALAALCVGDEVRITDGIRPRYLQGLHGNVVAIGEQDVTIRLHRPVGRFTSGHVRCSVLALERIGAAPTRKVA